MKNTFVLKARISATRTKLLGIASDICYHLQETKEDLEIASMLLFADDWIRKAITTLQKKEVK